MVLLWFGDERGYNATRTLLLRRRYSCGLVMKEDITQRITGDVRRGACCGLVMKEDITQHTLYPQGHGSVVVW